MSTKKFYYFLIASNLMVLFLFGNTWYQKVQDLTTWMLIDEYEAWIKTFPAAIVPFVLTLFYLVYMQLYGNRPTKTSDLILDSPELVSSTESPSDSF